MNLEKGSNNNCRYHYRVGSTLETVRLFAKVGNSPVSLTHWRKRANFVVLKFSFLVNFEMSYSQQPFRLKSPKIFDLGDPFIPPNCQWVEMTHLIQTRKL